MATEKEVLIPSLGKLNQDQIPEGTIKVRNLTVAEEKLMVSNKLLPTEKIVTVVGKCLVEPQNFDINYLPIVDVIYALFEIRNITFKEPYEFQVKCGSCNNAFTHAVNVPDDLDVTFAEKEIEEPFEAKLPDAGNKLGLRYLRAGDQVDIERQGRQRAIRSKGQDTEYAHILQLSRRIVSLDEEKPSPAQVEKFVEGLSVTDAQHIREVTEERDFGIDLNLLMECPICGTVHEEFLRPDANFFRSRKSKRTG